MPGKILPITAMLISLFMGTGCFNTPGKDSAASLRKIGNVKLYTFLTDDQIFLGEAQPYLLSPDTSLKDALFNLGNHLADTYFSRTYGDRVTHIRFEIQRIEEIPVHSGSFKVAVINMVDKNQFAMKQFFQGSTGAQITLSILGCTFIQPHLEHPLLDGFILLYNGKILPELDHIDLSGILTPRLFRYIARRAIYRTETKTAHRIPERERAESSMPIPSSFAAREY